VIAAGHEVTLFNRGRTNPGLFPEAEHLVGDRDTDLAALEGRSFDAVIDPSAYFPRQVTAVVDALDHIDHYTFVSSCSVYADHSIVGADEENELLTVEDPSVESLDSPDNYGGFKAMSEAALDAALPGRCHHVRAGLIVGPHDPTGRFTYWVERLGRGGEILAPEPQDQPVQFIDVGDLAAWILTAADNRVTGTLNATGPRAHTMATMLDQIERVVDGGGRLTWVAEDFLVDHEIEHWTDLPMWLPPGALPTHVGFQSRSSARAEAAGLRTRPLAETVARTVHWLGDRGPVQAPSTNTGLDRPPVGLDPERERRLLQEWAQRPPVTI
jgi:2'-hydroxyisoflavone reductase